MVRRAGQARDQAMATDEQRREDLVEHFVLSDDHLADLAQNVVAHGLEAFNALFQFRRVGIELCDGGHELFPFVGVLQLQQQLLRRAVARRGFERREDVVLGLILFARSKIGPGEIELRRRFVQGVHVHHGIVFANRAPEIVLRQP
jgi:hypothetical protein